MDELFRHQNLPTEMSPVLGNTGSAAPLLDIGLRQSPCIAAIRYPSPSTEPDAPNLASHSTAFASIVLNTGCNSPVELADHLEHIGGGRLLLERLRQVIGALRSSLSSRVFSMAMTACVGEILD